MLKVKFVKFLILPPKKCFLHFLFLFRFLMTRVIKICAQIFVHIFYDKELCYDKERMYLKINQIECNTIF